MNRRLDNDRTIRAPHGPGISAKSWLTEAPLRMLMNNLDPDVAERPSELVVYGGIGRAARDWDSFDRIVASLRKLDGDQTLVVQSGKPVGIFRTHPDAPRVLIANSNLVPHWATLDHFNELDKRGLMMFGQMTAGSWIYIGSQGIVQGTYETFVEVGRRHYGGNLAGKWILTAGLGGMGGAQPLAATMAGASMLAIECQPSRIEMRLRTGYLDRQASTLDEALAMMAEAAQSRKPRSVGLLGNAADIFPELVRRGARPDIVTDQTSAHDPINGYLPKGWTLAEWEFRREADPKADLATVADARQKFANIELMRGNVPHAAQLLAQAEAFWASVPTRYAEERVEGLGLRARERRAAGDLDGAIATMRAAIEQRLVLTGRVNRETAVLYNSFGIILTAAHRLGEGEARHHPIGTDGHAVAVADPELGRHGTSLLEDARTVRVDRPTA